MGRIYNDLRWRRLRRAKLAANPACEYHPAGAFALAVDVDHRVPISRGGDPLAWSNLVSSCHECHSSKTRNVDVLGRDHFVPRIKGVDAATGLPVDPGHWWRKR